MKLEINLTLQFDVVPSGTGTWEERKKEIADLLLEGLLDPTELKGVKLESVDMFNSVEPTEAQWEDAKKNMLDGFNNWDAINEFRSKLRNSTRK